LLSAEPIAPHLLVTRNYLIIALLATITFLA